MDKNNNIIKQNYVNINQSKSVYELNGKEKKLDIYFPCFISNSKKEFYDKNLNDLSRYDCYISPFFKLVKDRDYAKDDDCYLSDLLVIEPSFYFSLDEVKDISKIKVWIE